ncbi:unnamed protein product [Sphagnum troendelagicum]|uniref:Protein kinase domain-containing protein n=1 Tax=Sphagnum troendelagicum TaxID=128251 RepID=A0ABP0TCR8_9BRYO
MAAAKVWKTNCINKEAAEKEASLFSKLQHPNVVQFIGYGVKESQPVIVSELMSTDLRRYLDEKKKNAGEGPPLPLLVAMNILVQIAEAMNYLHENGVMHRDLKANNVLINVVEGSDGQFSSSSVQVKLTDFGESKLKLYDSGYTTPMVGTTRWRAPEVFEVEDNREKYTKSADVYSFSMVCFEVLTGDVPFKDKPLGTLLQSIRDGLRPQLPDADYCPNYFCALIEKCWATNAVERPQFPIIYQLLMDYKARVLKHPCGQEDVPPDYRQNLQAVDLAGTDYVTYILEDDNNHRVREPATSLLQEVQSLSVDRPYCEFSFKELEAATSSFSHMLRRVQSIFVYQPSPRRFSSKELDTATASFSSRNLVHEDGFSKVYRGELQDGRLLAIECAKDSKCQEILLTGGLEINSCLSHANIVSLIGYCVENTLLILVYDFLHQQTLHDLLHGEENVLGWEVRYKVAVGICKALEYLQDGSPQPVIHGDVRPSKILLSHDFRPQVLPTFEI